MHFIAMHAIVMGDDDPALRLTYSPAFTIGSFFLPIVVIAVAFFVVSASRKVNAINFVLGGLITGTAICGMHYLGATGVRNYVCIFDFRMVVASVVIALLAATVALGVFFRFKYAWTDAGWKRGTCALALASAISLMHWTASLGTTYQWLGIQDDGASLHSTAAIGVCGGLAFLCCGVLIAFPCFWQRARRKSATRAQQVVVAAAVWDPEGRLLLNAGGRLPCRKVTNTYIQRSFKDEFTVSHPVYSWIYRVSTNWRCVADLIPSMRGNLDTGTIVQVGRSAGDREDSVEITEDYACLFKQLFCVAAQDLAVSMQEDLENVSVLYDRIINTGTVAPRLQALIPNTPSSRSTRHDLESGESQMSTLGRGQLLFLVRHVNRSEAWKLQARGFSFAPVPVVVDQLAQSMRITPQELQPHLADLLRYKNMPRPMKPGVYVSCFTLRPLVGRGFEVLADKQTRNLLPSVKLSLTHLEPGQAEVLRSCDGWEASKILRRWTSPSHAADSSSEQAAFVSTMVAALGQLSERVGPDLFRGAKLAAKPFAGPIGAATESCGATVIGLHLICNVHTSLPRFAHDEFVPSRLFFAQQHAYPGSADHAAFAGAVKHEFASLERSTTGERRSRFLHANATRSTLSLPSGRRRFASLRGHLARHFGSRFLGRQSNQASAEGLTAVSHARAEVMPDARRSEAGTRLALGSDGGSVAKEISLTSVNPRPGSGDSAGADAEAVGRGDIADSGARKPKDSMMDELMGLALGASSPAQP